MTILLYDIHVNYAEEMLCRCRLACLVERVIRFDGKSSEQVRTTIVHTLSNVYKIHKWVSPVIKIKFEQLSRTEGIPTRILVVVVHALHSMAISGANLET